MKVLILAAGYATRLYPLTKECPKSLLQIDKRPVIDYILDKLEGIGQASEVIVVTNSKFVSQFKRWARSRAGFRKRLSILDDLTWDNLNRRGAIGDMYFTINKRHIGEDLLVIGGDNLFDGSLQRFVGFARGKKPAVSIGVYDIRKKSAAKKYGVVRLSQNKRIVCFQEKPLLPESSLVAMCLYYFPKERLRLIREYLDSKMEKRDATGYYIDWLRRKIPVYGFIFKGRWYDIGDRKLYHRAKTDSLYIRGQKTHPSGCG